jgi:MYXO-CTERM domain-containing protein
MKKMYLFFLAAVMVLVGVGTSYARVDVPEPGSLMYLAMGLGGLVSVGLIRRRRK